MALSENKQKMRAGELYLAFTPELVAERSRCELACERFNTAGVVPRRTRVEMWRAIVGDKRPLPPTAATAEEDETLFEEDPWVMSPLHIDYGYNLKVGAGVFLNFNLTVLDTCEVTIGARTLVGPNVSLFSGTHPLDPALRNGTAGPELGKEIRIGEDCWIGGNAMILPGVTLGRGVVVGAGSVVTKDVPNFWVVAGNPARMIRKIETTMDPEHHSNESSSLVQAYGAERVMAEMAKDTEMKGTIYNDDEQGW